MSANSACKAKAPGVVSGAGREKPGVPAPATRYEIVPTTPARSPAA